MTLSRRGVLKAGVAAGGGLLVGVGFAEGPALFAPNAFIRVPSVGPIQVVLSYVEMGQGTFTGTAMLIAEELEVDPKTLEVVLAPAANAYDNAQFGFQLTGGSSSTASGWLPLRQAGASARELLKEAAARRFQVPRRSLTASLGRVLHAPTGRSASYQELAAVAATLPVESAPLKTKDFKVVGKSVPRLDAVEKSNGSAVFGLDVKVPGALVAVVLRCPVHGGTVKSFDGAAAKAMPGVRHVVQVPSGIAVVAQTSWHARQAAQAVTVEWDEGPFAAFSTSGLHAERLGLIAKGNGHRMRSTGDADARLALGGTTLEAAYELPFLAHATMEPQNATAHVTATRCEVWAPTQGPGMAREQLSRLLDLPMDAVEVHQTFVGGGFGRRISQDYAVEAAQVSKAIGGPVKVVWSREDDMRHSFYRPAATHSLKAAFGAGGRLEAWRHAVATQSILSDTLGDIAPAMMSGAPGFVKRLMTDVIRGAASGADSTSVEGAAELPYAIDHVAVDLYRHETGAPTGFWRSVGHSHTAFATESFIDECAHAVKADPFEFRRQLLQRKHRLKWVLELAAEQAGWGAALPDGLGRGLAAHESFNSFAACVAEVRVVDARVVVTRLVLALDCGRVVNPDVVKSQLESAAVFGLSATLSQRITYEQGRVQQSNFHDFAPLRLADCPLIETHLRDNAAAPTGVGEPGVPVIAPAVANAVFALTGKRLRALPLSLEGT